MKYETLDDLYSGYDITIFQIKDYLYERYGEMIDVYWDCQEDWSTWKKIFCTKKTGYEIEDDSVHGRFMVTFYDKDRETVERLEEELKTSDRYRLYSLLHKFDMNGIANIEVEDGKIALHFFRNYEAPKNSLLYKLKGFGKDNIVDWTAPNGVELSSIVVNEELLMFFLDIIKQ